VSEPGALSDTAEPVGPGLGPDTPASADGDAGSRRGSRESTGVRSLGSQVKTRETMAWDAG